MTPSGSAQDTAREAIGAAVRGRGARLKDATATGMVAALVAAALAPIATGPDPAKALAVLLGVTGGGYISDFVKGVIGRLRSRDGGGPVSEAEAARELERELLACLQAPNGRAAELRVSAAALLEAVQGTQAALEAAGSDEIKQALTGAFAEFKTALDESLRTLTAIHRTQRYHTDQGRQMLVMLELLVGRQSAAAVAAEPTQQAPACPYMGLAPFQAEDAQWFFGRERLVADLVVRLSETPFLTVVGPSGSGKSSALRAGLLPAIWDGALAGAQVWTTIVLTPGAHPVEELAVRLATACKVAAESLLGDWRARPGWLRLAVRQALAEVPEGARLLLLVDQFEETFTLCTDEAERRGFVLALAALAGGADTQAIAVLGVRADFYARCAEYPELVALIQDRQVLVGPMSPAELRVAIAGPSARAGLALEPGLVETVLADLGEEPGSLPLLSHALLETWRRRQGETLTIDGYRETGGVREAIGRTADTVYARFDPAQQRIAKDVLLRLTALGEGTEDTRRLAKRAELLGGREPESVGVVFDRLATARLVILDENSAQVAHEALIREWPLLRQWLTEDREGLRTHRRLTDAAAEWQALDRDPGALYRGARLAAAREWAADHEERLNDLERAFLTSSCDQERDELAAARRRELRLRALAGTLAVVLVLTVTLGALTFQRQRDEATARQLVTLAAARLDQQPLSLLLSLESLRLAPALDEPRDSLLRGLLEPPHSRLVLSGHTGGVEGVAFSPDSRMIASASGDGTLWLWDSGTGTPIGQPLTGHTGSVMGVAFSPDGTTIASAGDDRTVRLWDAATGEPIGQPLTGHTERVEAVAFSPDGEVIASASRDQTVRRWDTTTGQPIDGPLTGHSAAVRGVAFSPSGTTIASASDDHTVRLWDANTGHPMGPVLTGHTGTVIGVAFSPDGTKLASASADRTVRLWNAVTGQPIGRPFIGHTYGVIGVAFAPDGKTLASVSDDRTVQLWDAASGQQIGQPLIGHTDHVWVVAFSPDGKTIATGSRDRTVRLWDAKTSPPLARSLIGHTNSVRALAFSPDGTKLASAGADRTVRLWDAASATPIGQPMTGHTGQIEGLAYSLDGKTLATASDDRTIRLWDADTGNPKGPPLTGHTGFVKGVAFSPDSRMVASASRDHTVRLWDANTGKQIGQPLTGHTGGVWGAAFSPDGKTLATASYDRTVRLWDTATGEQIGQPLTGHTDGVMGVAFSPDGKTLATASYDRTVRQWDVSTQELFGVPLTGHSDTVWGVAFSPDGTTIASVSGDRTVRLWNLNTQELFHVPLTGHTDRVWGVAFSPDGGTLASASRDFTVRLWPLGVDAWIRHACTVANRNLTQDEWDRFVGADRPYVRGCGDFPPGAGAPVDAPVATYPLT